MKLIITRHGETEENVKRTFMGHNPGTLTKKGIEQAKKLSERLRHEKIDVIFSSDLARAADTAKEIAKFHPDVPIYFVKELRERFLGDAQGKTKEEIEWYKKENRGEIMKKLGAEETSVFVDRARKFNVDLLERFHGKNVLLVGHAGINTAIMANILNKEWQTFFNKNKPSNTAITIFEFDKDKKPELKLMNCIKHLEDNSEGV